MSLYVTELLLFILRRMGLSWLIRPHITMGLVITTLAIAVCLDCYVALMMMKILCVGLNILQGSFITMFQFVLWRF